MISIALILIPLAWLTYVSFRGREDTGISQKA
jgi:hypothetical protein